MNTPTDPIATYRRRLEAASEPLPPDVRADLIDDLDGHLEEIRRTAATDADVRDALDRLGPPEEIAAAASSELGAVGTTTATGPPPPVAPARTGVGTRDVLAILLLVFGTVAGMLVFVFFPPLMPVGALAGFVAGLVLLWTSGTWTAGEKLLATLVWPGGVLLPLLLGTLATQVCVSDGTTETCQGFAFPPAVGIPLAIAVLAAPIVIGALLLIRAHRRAAV